MSNAPRCDYGDWPVDSEGWHIGPEDPEGLEGRQRVPCGLAGTPLQHGREGYLQEFMRNVFDSGVTGKQSGAKTWTYPIPGDDGDDEEEFDLGHA